MRSLNCGNSSAGRAQPCQGWGREFESRFPLQFFVHNVKMETCTFWRNGRMAMQRIANPWISVRLRVPPPLYLHCSVSTRCPGGEIGRHKGFKIPRW